MTRLTMEPQSWKSSAAQEMTDPSPFMAKVIQVFMNFNKMVGTDF